MSFAASQMMSRIARRGCTLSAPISARVHQRAISVTAIRLCDAPSEPAIEVPSADSAKAYSPKITAIVDEISTLNLVEVVDLVDALKSKLNISDAMLAPAAVAMPAGGGGAAPAAAAADEEAPAAEKTEFDVKLASWDDKSKIKVIKEVRAITSLGLKEAKEFVEKSPNVVKTGLTKEEAEEMVERLKAVGAVCEIE